MRKKKWISIVLLFIFLFNIFPLNLALANTDLDVNVFIQYISENHLSIKETDELLKDNPNIYYDDHAFVDLYLADINASIEEVFGVAGFYPKSITVTGSNGVTKTLSVNAQFLKERRIVVYGSPQDVKDLGYTNDLSSQGHYRYLGFDRDSTLVTNPRIARSSAAKEFKPNDMVWNLSRSASYIAKGVISESDNITKTIGTSHQARVIAGTIRPNGLSYDRVVDSGGCKLFCVNGFVP